MSLFTTLSVAASGMAAQRTRAEVLAENLANADTTRTPDGGPYRRKDVVFEPQSGTTSPFAGLLAEQLGDGGTGVAATAILVDEGEPNRRYSPGHPDADKDGYVAMPRVNPTEEMVDLMGASRGYQANVAAFSAAKEMIHRSIDLLKA
ncbi:MAG TPA: flagellar basal body rod protein FlgC [Bryobacteraceae bacterium]|nr:flagellar basal body rod protein FlgC [Bryobacteraceae bacterium]